MRHALPRQPSTDHTENTEPGKTTIGPCRFHYVASSNAVTTMTSNHPGTEHIVGPPSKSIDVLDADSWSALRLGEHADPAPRELAVTVFIA
jgi:hypothetical protein